MQKPLSIQLRTPFPCGTLVRISCAYGPHCSPAHRRVQSKTSTNDYYAVDFIRPGKRHRRHQPVVAAASGVVRFAGWAVRGWAPYGKVVYLEHDQRDSSGNRYQTLYAHLHQVSVRPGQRVKAGTVIGIMGGSSRRRLHKLGTHLHFAMYQNAKPTLGGGRAVVPEPLGFYDDLKPRMHLVACEAPRPTRLAFQTESGPLEPLAFGGLLPAPAE